MANFEGFKTSVHEVTADGMEIARELEVEAENMTELLQSHDKSFMDEEFLLTGEQRIGFLRWYLLLVRCHEGCWVRTKDLEYDISLVGEAAAGFEKSDAHFGRSFTWVKSYQTALPSIEKSFMKGRTNWCSRLHCCFILRNCHSHLSLQQPPHLSVSNHQHQGKNLHQHEDFNSLKAWTMVSIF